jgi:hypothetical protein
MSTDLPQWTSSRLLVDEIPTDQPYGFVYQITYEDDTYYYGMKKFYSYVTLPTLKSGEKREGHIRFTYKNGSGKRKHVEEIRRESDWKKYTGSNDVDLPIINREILAYARTKRELTYLECKCLFQTEALEDPLCHNSNINGMWFKDKLI